MNANLGRGRSVDIDAVSTAVREVEQAEISPRFRALAAEDVIEKSPGEIVTAADRACEAVLGRRLQAILDIPVVGEESVADDPALLGLVADRDLVWVVDPLDGTSNFAAGSTDHAVMVALVESGDAVASWMWHPASRTMAVAERGSGSFLNDQRVTMKPVADVSRAVGVVKDRFLPDDVAATVLANEARFGRYDAGRGCAGVEYPALVADDVAFLLYWRTLPWDHAPGVLFAEEAGGVAVRPDGRRYRCGEDGLGLVVAHAAMIDEVRACLLSTADRPPPR